VGGNPEREEVLKKGKDRVGGGGGGGGGGGCCFGGVVVGGGGVEEEKGKKEEPGKTSIHPRTRKTKRIKK